MNRISKRAGFDILRGSTNPRIHMGKAYPKDAVNYDIWFNLADNNGTAGIYIYWGGSWYKYINGTNLETTYGITLP